MKESPILFSTEMVQAILDGRKTMTRRKNIHNTINESPDKWLCNGTINEDGFFTFGSDEFHTDIDIYCPYGKPGDILWVREKFETDLGQVNFYAGNPEVLLNKAYVQLTKWKPSIHMPKAAARIWLQITDIRVERLHEITDEDAIAEGIKVIEKDEAYFDYQYNVGSCATAKGSFYSLWTSINGQESFDANPLVWVISFKVLSTTGKPSEL
jgi:hypothetical protein